MFSKILVAVDGSEHSRKALTYAIALAEKFDAEITLIHAYSIIIPISLASLEPRALATMTSTAPNQVVAQMLQETKKAGEQILSDSESETKEHGIKVNKIIKEGNIVREIVSVATTQNFDLIVVGRRGMSKLKKLLLGSVSEGVTREATCPVMIVK